MKNIAIVTLISFVACHTIKAQETQLPIMVSGVAFPSRPVDRYVSNTGLLLTIINSSRIQKELKLTKSKSKQIGELHKKRQNELAELYRVIDRQQLNELEIAKAGDEISSLHQQYEQQALDILTERQRKRLVQLVIWEKIWRHGFANLLLNSKLGKTLNVTEQQKANIRKIAKELVTEIEALDEWCQSLIHDELLKKLNPKQRVMLKKIIGKNEKAKSWKPMTSTFQLAWLTQHWDQKLKEKILGVQPNDNLRPSSTSASTVSASQNTPLQFVMFLKVNGIANELDLVRRQQNELQQAETTYRKKINKLIAENKQLRKTDLKTFREIIKKAEQAYCDHVLQKILVSHQAILLKRLYYNNDIRRNGLLHCLLDNNELSLGKTLKVTGAQRISLKDTLDIVQRILKKQKKLQRGSVYAFVESLQQEQREMVDTHIGDAPKTQPYTTLDSVAIQLKYAIGQTRPKR